MKMILRRSLFILLFTPLTILAQEEKKQDTPNNSNTVKEDTEKSDEKKVKGEAKANGKDSIKIADPKTIHDHFINNLVDAADVVFHKRNDLEREPRAYLYSTLRSLAENEKDGNTRALLNHELVKSLDSLVEKFGAENAKQRLGTYLDARVLKYPKTLAYKKEGIDDDFLKIVKDSMARAVDAVKGQAKDKKPVEAKAKEGGSVWKTRLFVCSRTSSINV